MEYSGHPSAVREFEESMSDTFLRLWLLQNTGSGCFGDNLIRF
ncbi:MAG: hypothetical protein QXU50_02250 [Candidatus Korarchaeum sp.]